MINEMNAMRPQSERVKKKGFQDQPISRGREIGGGRGDRRKKKEKRLRMHKKK